MKSLRDERSCREFLERLRWPNGEIVCPRCGSVSEKHYRLKTDGHFNGVYKCRDCRKTFTVTVGTMFEGSHVSLQNWFIVIYLFLSDKKGMSSIQIAKYIGVTQKTAWFMLFRIRHNLENKIILQFKGVTQVDETYVGGKNRKRGGKKGTQGRSTKIKTPVMGLLSDGMIYTQVVPDTKARTLKPIIYDLVEEGSTIVSDEWRAYIGLSKYYNHEVVKHKQKEYVNKKGYHVNSVEGAWGHLKRMLKSTYIFASRKHLSKYCKEFDFRYNTRNFDDGLRFTQFVASAYKRLKYKDLIADIA